MKKLLKITGILLVLVATIIIGFLIFGPMLDIKNTLMLTGTFDRKFMIKLIFLIIAVCFIMAIVANYTIPISLKFLGGF